MPTVQLASPLLRFVPIVSPGQRSWPVVGTTVREVLDAFLSQVPSLRGYLLDETGALRHHIAAFVDGVVVRDKVTLSEAVPGDGEVFLVPALSGG